VSDHWIQTYSGRKFFPMDPRVEDVCIVDIAHALSQKCRFTGHCSEFWSVANHSIAVAGECSGKNALVALMHDAAEAYMPDVASPIKSLLPDIIEMESRLWKCIAERFDLPLEIPIEVKTIDLLVLESERRRFMSPCKHDWGIPSGRFVKLDHRPAHQSKTQFIRMFTSLQP
jgi:hypothetical protein